MATLPISIINIICEYAAHMNDSLWIPVFNENTHVMKKIVNKYSSKGINLVNTLLDRKSPRKIRMLLNDQIFDAEIFPILTYPSVKYYIRHQGKQDIVIFFDLMDGLPNGSLLTNEEHYPINYVNFSPVSSMVADIEILCA